MWVLSGVFFASTNFPAPMQPFIQALPLTALNDALRALMLEGTGAGGFAGELTLLAGWGGLTFLTALRVFRWS
jgi:ABC-type polysaccharide/polyol phosphate export permease